MTAVSAGLLPALAGAAPWELNPNVQLPDDDAVTTQKLELVDINVDGFVDIVLANSKGNETGSQADAEMNQVMLNQGGTGFTEMGTVFDEADTAWTIKAGDLDNDGDPDLVVGINFLGASYVLMNDNGSFTKQMLPGMNRSIGDLELGDVDGDGNLDIFAADWGIQQPYGDPDDLGGPMVLWLGDGMGNFTEANANLPMGMNALSSWTFDLELVDFDNDFDLDAFVSNRGGGRALVFQNDGTGTFELYPFPGLQPMTGKNVNVAFTPIDLNGDDYVDFVTLQDGPGQGACVVIDGDQICAKRNAVLINDKMGQAPDATNTFWDMGSNPPKLDFDAATLDFNNNGTPDLVLTGLRLGGLDPNNRLLLNSGTQLKNAAPPNDIALPTVPELGKSFGLMFADFNRDRREDVAVATRDPALPSFALFGRTDPAEGVPEDTTGPKLAPFEMLPNLLYFGATATGRTRAHDYKTPSHWHDYQFDDQMGTYNLTGPGDVAQVHKRRIPYMEFALSLANADDIKTLPDNDPTKYIAPGLWYGEALWRVAFEVPYNNKKEDTLTWQWCAIDAAGNKSCLGPFQVMLAVDPEDCGNGSVEPWEECDGGDLCNAQCENTCGDGMCVDPENFENCPEDCTNPCDNDGACEPPENEMNCPNDCDGTNVCGDDICGGKETPMNCPEDCPCDFDGVCEPPESEQFCPDCGAVTDSGGDCDMDGVCEAGETIDGCPSDCACDMDGICEPPKENNEVCPSDCECDNDGVCEPPKETAQTCPNDCGECGDGFCAPGEDCPQDCSCNNDGVCQEGVENEISCPNDCGGGGDTDCDSAGGAPGQCELDDDGCGCVTEPTDSRGLWASLLLFGAFGVRRFRKRA